MNRKDKFVVFLNRMTCVCLVLSVALIAIGLNVSGIKQSYFIFIGGSLIVSSVIVFLFGLFMFTMEDITDAPKNYHNLNQNIHNFQTNRLY